MPTNKKKMPEQVFDENAEVMKEAFNRGAQLPAVLCGHINKQFINKDGQLQDLACTLPKGHDGDHFARYVKRATDYGILKTDRGSQQVVTGSHEIEAEAWWSDGAGTPVAPITLTREQDFERLQKARVRERGTDEALGDKIDKEVRSTYGG